MKGGVTSTASGTKNPDMKADNWFPGRATITKEESEGVEPTAAERQEVDEVLLERALEHWSGRRFCNVCS